MSIIVQEFRVTNKSVFDLFCSVLLSQEAQADARVTRKLPEDGGRETRDDRHVKARGTVKEAQ